MHFTGSQRQRNIGKGAEPAKFFAQVDGFKRGVRRRDGFFQWRNSGLLIVLWVLMQCCGAAHL